MKRDLIYSNRQVINISAHQILPNELFDFSKNLRVVYVVDGEVSIQFTSGAKKLCRDGVEIIGINEPVRLSSHKKNTVLFFTIDGDFAKSLYERIDRMILNCNFNFIFPSQVDDEKLQELRSFLNKLFTEYIQSLPTLRLSVEQLLSLLVTNFDSFSNVLNHIPNEDLHKERFNNINSYMIDNLNGKIRLADLVDQEYVSSQYLSKEFKKKYGISFSELLSYYRIIHSVRLLTNTKLSLSEVSEQCGFSASRYYNKYFRKFLGISPSEFRQQLTSHATQPQVFKQLNLREIWKKYQYSIFRLLWVIPPICNQALQLLSKRLNSVFAENQFTITLFSLNEFYKSDLLCKMDNTRAELLELAPQFDGIIVATSQQDLIDNVRQSTTIPVIDLWEATRAYLRLNGFSFVEICMNTKASEIPIDFYTKYISQKIEQTKQIGGKIDVVLLEDFNMLPYFSQMIEKYNVIVTDGINEGSLILNALFNETALNQRSKLQKSSNTLTME